MCLPKTYVSINITLTHWRLISTLHSWLCLMSKQLYAAVTVCTACWLASRTRNPKVAGSSLRSGRYCRWGNWMYSALSSFNTTTEVPLSKAPNPQLLPGRRSINGCPLLRVCVHGVCVCSLLCVCTLDGINAEHKFQVWVTILGHMSRHFHFFTSLSLSFTC